MRWALVFLMMNMVLGCDKSGAAPPPTPKAVADKAPSPKTTNATRPPAPKAASAPFGVTLSMTGGPLDGKTVKLVAKAMGSVASGAVDADNVDVQFRGFMVSGGDSKANLVVQWSGGLAPGKKTARYDGNGTKKTGKVGRLTLFGGAFKTLTVDFKAATVEVKEHGPWEKRPTGERATVSGVVSVTETTAKLQAKDGSRSTLDGITLKLEFSGQVRR